jgi:tetratricopeptide (TPR) repeat protein
MFMPKRSIDLFVFMVAACIAVSPGIQSGARAQPPAPIATDADAEPAMDSAQLAIVEIGDLIALSGRYETAIRVYAKAPKMTAVIWNKMGMSYELMLNTQEAIRCYNESLKLNPGDPRVLNNLATLYESEKDYGNADRYFRKALSVDPHFAAVYKNLGTSLIAQHKFAEGQKAYARALAADPEVFAVNGNPAVESPGSTHERGAMNYFMALACVRTGQIERGLDYLRMSLNQGFVDPTRLASDSAFAALGGNPGFRKLIAEESGRQ